MKTAIVIGATGLIGGYLTNKLLYDERYSKVKIFVGRTIDIAVKAMINAANDSINNKLVGVLWIKYLTLPYDH